MTLSNPHNGSKRVIVVEDEPLIAYDLVAEIEASHHEVVGQCGSAVDAIALTEKLRPDVVIMDIGLLGDQNGLEAAREIRKSFGIGCVFVSATLDRVDDDMWGDIKPVALIRKPYRDKALSEAISSSDAA
ncbi:MAG: response regulator [Pseudomonadota bacterium]